MKPTIFHLKKVIYTSINKKPTNFHLKKVIYTSVKGHLYICKNHSKNVVDILTYPKFTWMAVQLNRSTLILVVH